MENAEIYKESIGKLLKETDNIIFRIRVLRDKNEKMNMENDKEIIEIKKKLMETEATLEKTLTESKENAIKVKCGWTHFRIMPDRWGFDEEKIIEVVINKYPERKSDYLKTTITIKKEVLKEQAYHGELPVEILEVITKEPQEKKFEYKYTGEK